MANLLEHPEYWMDETGTTSTITSTWNGSMYGIASSTSGYNQFSILTKQDIEVNVGDTIKCKISAGSISTSGVAFYLVLYWYDYGNTFTKTIVEAVELTTTEQEVEFTVSDVISGWRLGISLSNYADSAYPSSTYGQWLNMYPTATAAPAAYTTKVYELDKGWSFDGKYIPHFLELNWYFGEDPFTYTGIHKLRLHGLTKGNVHLSVRMSGMQGEPATDYITDYMDEQYLDIPFTPINVSSDFIPTTNYIDYADRGIAVQLRFDGRGSEDLPEPSHVIQVLALQSTPSGNGKRSN